METIETVDPAEIETLPREREGAGWELVGLPRAPVPSMVAAFRRRRD